MIRSFLHTQTAWTIFATGLFLAVLGSFVLALFGWFSPFLTAPLIGLVIGSIGAAIWSLVRSADHTRLIVLAGLTFLAVVIIARMEPSLFTGRDQGSIALAAWELAERQELAFSTPASAAFFAIYGPGTALNFPGFAYTESGALLTQFPLGYTSFLALFVSWFGLSGYSLANAILFVFSSWTFFELLALFVRRAAALLGIMLFSGSFLTVWLSQLSLTENLALPLFLTLALSTLRLIREPRALLLIPFFLAAFLLPMTRIEGFLISPIAFGILCLRPSTRALLTAQPLWQIALVGLSMGFLFLRDLFINLPFYTMIGKALTKYSHELSGVAQVANEPSLGPIFVSYGLFAVFVLGCAGMLWSLAERRFEGFWIVLIAAPTLVYLFDGHISDDHPWLLRRYAFTLFPLFLFFTIHFVVFLEERVSSSFRKTAFALAAIMLVGVQVWPFLQAINIRENQGLLATSGRVAALFGSGDLVLVDRLATGDPFSMLPGPLTSMHGLSAVYFFNPEDIQRIDREAFEHIYLIAPEDSLGRYIEAFEGELVPVEVLSFETTALAAPGPYRFPEASSRRNDALLFRFTEQP
jgi:hypothetical protein